jgi:hypothetical protein
MYSYCRHKGCDRGMDKATLSEVLSGVQLCGAEHSNLPNITKDEALIDLAETVEALEMRLQKLEQLVLPVR